MEDSKVFDLSNKKMTLSIKEIGRFDVGVGFVSCVGLVGWVGLLSLGDIKF